MADYNAKLPFLSPGAEYRPEAGEGGLPVCDERCPLHDGKRCEATGFRPDRYCEPALIDLRVSWDQMRSSAKHRIEYLERDRRRVSDLLEDALDQIKEKGL